MQARRYIVLKNAQVADVGVINYRALYVRLELGRLYLDSRFMV
jgi:hypothetical protein